MAGDFEITGDLAKLQKYLKTLRGSGLNRALNLGTYHISKAMGRIISAAYATAKYKQHDLTLAAYLEPAANKAKWTAVSPLQRSKELSQGVEVFKAAKNDWQVRINPNAVYKKDPSDSARGLPLATVAAWLEFGKTYLVTWTPKMRRYIAMLARKHGRGPSPSKSKDSGSGGGASKGTFIVRLDKRLFIPRNTRLRKGKYLGTRKINDRSPETT